MKDGLRLLRWIFGGSLAIYLAILIGIGGYGLFGPSPPVATVAVVLGTTANPDGSLSPRLKGRVDAALKLYQEKKVSGILVSGATGNEGTNEASAMARYLRQQGVPEAHLFVDSAGATTRATAQNVAQMIPGQDIIVVSSWYHLARSRLALGQEGAHVVGAAAATPFQELREIYGFLREGIALPVYWLNR